MTRLSTLEDPMLNTAFMRSLVDEIVPTFGTLFDRFIFRVSIGLSIEPDGTFGTQTIRFVDSARVRSEVLALHLDGHSHGTTVDASRHLPVFLFSTGSNKPLLVDKYYQVLNCCAVKCVAHCARCVQAKALHDMIVVTQSNVRKFHTRQACNGQTMFVDLRDPMRATLEAIGTLVGGLIPAHITCKRVGKRRTL